MTASPLRLLIADEGEADLDVIAEASGPEEAVRLAVDLAPDVVLMDLRFEATGRGSGTPDGVEAVRVLAARAPAMPVVMLTSYSGRVDVVRALEAGARGYVLRAGPPEDADRRPSAARPPAPGASTPGAGLTNRAIADSLCLSEATVRTHLVRVYRQARRGQQGDGGLRGGPTGLLEFT
nr:response regulator transcription factor [Streptomyces canus]